MNHGTPGPRPGVSRDSPEDRHAPLPTAGKIHAAYSALILLTTILLGVMVTRRIEADALREIEQDLGVRAVLLRDLAGPALAEPSGAGFQERIRALGREISTRLTVIAQDGSVIADSEEDPARMDNHADRPEIISVRSHGRGLSSRYSNTLGQRMMYLALPVHGEGGRLG